MIGTRVGRFEIVDQLGQGGMGVVWRARDTTLDRIVALKVLRIREPDNLSQFQQLIREARLASSLNHPNIVTIYEIGEHNGAVYIAMECIEGQTLQQLIPNGGMPVNEVLRITSEITDGLIAAHAAGLIHCDLKPTNIIVTPTGRVKLVDFGLAKPLPLLDEREDSSISFSSIADSLSGTPSYMSPEQVTGRKIDARSDLFSVGAVMYEALTGRSPFRGKSPALTMSAVARDEPAPIENILHDVERLVMRLLRKNPERRWQTALDLKAALEDLREETGTKFKPVDPPSRKRGAWPWIVLIAGTTVVATAFFVRRDSSASLPELYLSQFTTVPGLQKMPSFSADGNQLAYSWDGGHLHNFDIYVQAISGGDSLRLTSDPAIDENPVWSPTGERIAFTRAWTPKHKAIYIVGPLGGAEQRVYELPQTKNVDQSSLFCWTPDGKHLIVGERREEDGLTELVVVSVETGQRMAISPAGRYIGSMPAISPDGKKIAFIREDDRPHLWIADFDPKILQAREPRPATSDERVLEDPVWTSDGKELIVTDERNASDSRLLRITVGKGDSLHPVDYADSPAKGAVISRDGNRLAFTRSFANSNIWHLKLDSSMNAVGEPQPLIISSFLEMQPSWSPDGKLIAFESTRSGQNRAWVAGTDGFPLFQLGSGRERTGSPKFSPDGKWIAYDTLQPHRNVLITSSSGGPGREIFKEGEDAYSPSWSTDSKSIYVNKGTPPQVFFFRMPVTGGKLEQLTSREGRYPRESPDRKEIFFESITGQEFSDLWRIPIQGGEARLAISNMFARSWDIDREGIWFVVVDSDRHAKLNFQAHDSQEPRTIYHFKQPVMRGISVSPDRRNILFVQVDGRGSNIMVMENFR